MQAADKPAKPVCSSRRIPIGIAPRAWCAIAGNTVFYTEKCPPPGNFRPGTVSRKLYSVTVSGGAVRELLSLGHLSEDPVVDPARGILYTLRRIRDSNRNGMIDPEDRPTLWKISATGARLQELDTPLPPLAVNPATGALIAGNSRKLVRLRLGETTPEALPPIRGKLVRVWYDGSGQLFVLASGNRVYRLVNKRFQKTDSLGVTASGLLLKMVSGVPTLMPPAKQSWRFPLLHGKTRWIWLDSLSRSLELFLRGGDGCAVIAADPASGRWEYLYRFPANFSRFALSADRRTIVYLTTWDTDQNGHSDPLGLDKSGLSVLKIH